MGEYSAPREGDSMSAKTKPDGTREIAAEITKLTDAFSAAHLDEEYRDLCRKLVGKLARKRPSPLLQGKPGVWAAAIVHVIGRVNFLFDKAQKPHVTAAQLCERASVSKQTVLTRSKEICRLFKIGAMDPEYTRPSRLGDNPFAWLVQVNGLVLDARMLPEHLQAEARERGMIPDQTRGT